MARYRPSLMLAVALMGMAGCATPGLYKSGRGPHPIEVREATLPEPGQPRDVVIRVVAPRNGGPYPLVLFSTGAYCAPEGYAAITDHWASHGYVVIAPTHVDVVIGRDRMKPSELQQMLWWRLAELKLATDAADSLAGPGKADTARMAVAGHSLGAMIAIIRGGVRIADPATGATDRYADPRFAAVLSMSGVGLMPPMVKDAFDGLTRPLLANGGTLDSNDRGPTAMFSGQWRMSPYKLAPPGDKYSVFLEDSDHFFGGLMCRDDRGGKPDPEGLGIVLSTQTAFLDAYLKGDRQARRYLERADFTALTQGRATVSRK